MPIVCATPAIKKDVFDLLIGFMGDYDRIGGRLEIIRDQMYRQYSHLGPLTIPALESYICLQQEVEMLSDNRVLHLEPSEDNRILPLLILQSKDGWVHLSLYTLLLMLDEDSELKSVALRFETDESQAPTAIVGKHDFCHAQFCRRINARTHALTPGWLPDSQPSIPLDADDQVTLVLCMLVSLYGGRYVVDRVTKLGNKNLLEHMKKLRALKHPGTTANQ